MYVVTLKTSKGDITLKLYDETPIHRDNFVKLCKSGYYDNTLFHRVIKDFMIQGGDPDSRNASASQMLGTGGPGYTIEAEIKSVLFHKRGTLAAARQGDEVNPERRSSGSQFYISWGQVYTEGQMSQLEKQLKQMTEQQIFQRLVTERKSEIIQMRRNHDHQALSLLQDELIAQAKTEAKEFVVLNESQKQAYTTIGGIPHLDGQYTVFGEVIEGLDVVETIQKTETRRGDRPQNDIIINSTIVVDK